MPNINIFHGPNVVVVLARAPLNNDGGLTHWILVDGSLPENERPVLASCESVRKPALIRVNGTTKEVITHGIGSVFCYPEHRGKGYPRKMLTLVGEALETWQTDKSVPGMEECRFSILYSDIGKEFYKKLGWHPYPSTHLEFAPSTSPSQDSYKKVHTIKSPSPELELICENDVKNIKDDLSHLPAPRAVLALTPCYETMQWHHLREEFMTNKLLGSSPDIRGATSGGISAVWTRAYYGPLEDPKAGNTLYILRLSGEKQGSENDLKAVLEVAQAEAARWKCGQVQLWNPSKQVEELVSKTGIKHNTVHREKDSIPSVMWYGEEEPDEIEWLHNEKFGWC